MKGSEKGDTAGRGDFVEIDPSLGNRELPVVRIDGPYGAPAEEFSSCEVAVLIGAGIGVTPFASILKHIWYKQKKGGIGSLKRVEFFWVCRDTPSFGWFQTLLQEVEAAQADPNFLRINIYLTQKIGEDMLWNIAINDAGADYDPLTLLRSRTMFGRPDWNAIFGKMREAIDNGSFIPGSRSQLKTTVGTYFCGPGALAKAIKKATEDASTDTVRFTFAKVSILFGPRCPHRFLLVGFSADDHRSVPSSSGTLLMDCLDLATITIQSFATIPLLWGLLYCTLPPFESADTIYVPLLLDRGSFTARM